jgi:N-acetylglucosaminyl-diphospho-decaprenol L-rhamnosyltransferase
VTSSLENTTAVVLNWRTPDHSARAIRQLAQDGLPESRIVIVDNASADGSIERFRSEFPLATVVAMEENVGFARGNNEGAAVLRGSAYLFVNSDAFVYREGSTTRLIAALTAGVGIAVPRLLNSDLTLQPSVVPASTPLPEVIRASGLSRFVPDRWQPALGTHWSHGYSRPIQAATGAVLAVGGDAWRALGGFAESQFMYAEDLDLCWRARRLGWEVQFVAEAEFIHLGSASASSMWSDPERAERVARAEAAMIRKNLPGRRSALTLGFMAAGVGARAVAFAALRDRVAAEASCGWWRGYVAGLRG